MKPSEGHSSVIGYLKFFCAWALSYIRTFTIEYLCIWFNMVAKTRPFVFVSTAKLHKCKILSLTKLKTTGVRRIFKRLVYHLMANLFLSEAAWKCTCRLGLLFCTGQPLAGWDRIIQGPYNCCAIFRNHFYSGAFKVYRMGENIPALDIAFKVFSSLESQIYKEGRK